ncbi:MAG: methionine biosynthesis protein MetW [Elusimicrobiota bacterium]|jgi:methionine biosynthesis protein MetW|nr:methionine biosynthesis protein MetW [Elusimicrobiota bacterium]
MKENKTASLAPLEYRKIASIINKNSSVLDLGCGSGELLHYLIKTKSVNGQGIEIDEEAVYSCVEKGLTVFHSDIEGGLDAYPSDSFDYVIMYNSIQQVKNVYFLIEESFRVGRKIIIGFPNFAYISARISLLFGHSPVTKTLPYKWHDTPNLRFLSINDFQKFCAEKKYGILDSFFFAPTKTVSFLPNLTAQTAVFAISKK